MSENTSEEQIEIHPIKIAFCITDLDPGGAERALVQLVTRLDRRRWEPRVYCLGPFGSLAHILEAAGIPTVCFGVKRWWQVGIIWQLSRALRKFQPQILQTFLFHANLMGRLAGWMGGVKHCISGVRVAERRHVSYLRLDRWTESFVERHVCVSQSVADFSQITGGLSAQKLTVIRNGVDADRIANAKPLDLNQWELSEGADVWVTVGRLDPQKGPLSLFEAVRELTSTHPRLRLLWAGEGPLRNELQAWIDAHQLQSIIRLIGWRDDIPNLLRAAHGFVLASNWEGMPNVILEALAAGLPTVSTRAEGVDEIIRHGETGWLTPIGDSVEFARTWNQVLDNETLRREVAAAGQRHVRQEFSWDRMARQYAALYEKSLGLGSQAK